MQLVSHKKAHQLYQIISKTQAGVVLTGAEVKSLRLGHASLVGCFVKPIGTELFLVNCQISPYTFADHSKIETKRTLKLLLKKKEIYHLIEAMMQKGATLVPLSFDLEHNKIKLTIGLARGKKQYERRDELKSRAIDRALAKKVKHQFQ